MTLEEALAATLMLRDGEGGPYAERWNYEALPEHAELYPLLHVEHNDSLMVVALAIVPYLHPTQAIDAAAQMMQRFDFEPEVVYLLATGVRDVDDAVMLLGFDLLNPTRPMMEVRCD